MKEIEVKTQKELNTCVKEGNIAIIRKGVFIAYDSSQITAYGKTQVTASDAQVRAYDSSQVTANGSSQITAYDSSQITAYDSSQITAYGKTQVTASDSAQVIAYGSARVIAYGYVAITQHGQYIKVSKGRHCRLIKVPPIENLQDYLDRYPIEQNKDAVFLFKAVNKDMRSLYSSRPIKYPKSGVVTNDKLDPPEAGSCANGLHFAHLKWVIDFALDKKSDGDFLLLKAKIPKDRIIASPNCNGKIRTDYAEIVEVIEDWRSYQFAYKFT